MKREPFRLPKPDYQGLRYQIPGIKAERNPKRAGGVRTGGAVQAEDTGGGTVGPAAAARRGAFQVLLRCSCRSNLRHDRHCPLGKVQAPLRISGTALTSAALPRFLNSVPSRCICLVCYGFTKCYCAVHIVRHFKVPSSPGSVKDPSSRIALPECAS